MPLSIRLRHIEKDLVEVVKPVKSIYTQQMNVALKFFTVSFDVWVYAYFWVSERWWFCGQNSNGDQNECG
jgi:hypothetical protein